MLNGVIIANLVLVSILVLFVLLCIIGVIFGIKLDNRKDDEIKALKRDLESSKVRYDMLNEMYIEYKAENPIKTKYRVNEKVYIAENKKPYLGYIEEVRQGPAHEITYIVKYAEWKSTTLGKSVSKEQNKVYKTLADAIDGEKLM